jgi:hypothetical protein
MSNERRARGWSQADAVKALRAQSASELPAEQSLLRQWKRWEAGEVQPKEFYQPIIAAVFGTVTHAPSRLSALPYPENCDHHFVVDPMKFDYYAVDCYRTVGADSMAEHLAEEVIEANTDFDGLERAPMRMAEARITLGVVRAREGDLEGAVSLGMRALVGDRKSLPSLLMVSRDLTKVLNDRYSGEAQTQDYLDQLTTLTHAVLENPAPGPHCVTDAALNA